MHGSFLNVLIVLFIYTKIMVHPTLLAQSDLKVMNWLTIVNDQFKIVGGGSNK